MTDDDDPTARRRTGDEMDELLRQLGADPSAAAARTEARSGAADPAAGIPAETVIDPWSPASPHRERAGRHTAIRDAEVGVVADPVAGDGTGPRERGAVDSRHVDTGAVAVTDNADDVDEADDADGEEDETQQGRRARRALLDWVIVIAVSVFVAIMVRTFVLAHFVVDGTSMETTLDDGDRVFVNKLSYRLHDPNRGDVVVLHERTASSSSDLIKRVVGLESEEVEMRSCQVYIDGAKLDEPYLDPAMLAQNSCGNDFGPTLVRENHVFVMGDNRGVSSDSRVLGDIAEDDLVGRAFLVFWPVGHMRWL